MPNQRHREEAQLRKHKANGLPGDPRNQQRTCAGILRISEVYLNPNLGWSQDSTYMQHRGGADHYLSKHHDYVRSRSRIVK